MQQLVAGFLQGGIQKVDFCRDHGLSLSTLQRHLKNQRRELRKQLRQSKTAKPLRLIGLELAKPDISRRNNDHGYGLTVLLSGERRIVVEPGFDSATLKQLVNALERM